MSNAMWKSREDWVRHNPHKGHPQYEEWMRMKQKEKENENETTEGRH